MPIATFIIDGAEYREYSRGSVTLNTGKTASQASITIDDHRLQIANTHALPYLKKKNKRVSFQVFYGNAGIQRPIFKGYLSGLSATGLPGKVTLKAVDRAKGLRRVPRSRNLTNVTAQAAVKRLCEEGGLLANFRRADFSDRVLGQIIQMSQSNMELIERICDQEGHTFYTSFAVDPKQPAAADKVGTVHFESNREAPDKFREVTYGADAVNGFSFDVSDITRKLSGNLLTADQAEQWRNVEDPEDMDIVSHLSNTGMLLASDGTPEFLESSIRQQIGRLSIKNSNFTGSLTENFIDPEWDLGTPLLLKNFGPRFSGIWGVKSAQLDLVKFTTSYNIYNGGSE